MRDETWIPIPEDERRSVHLCLSGGGFRAALFHLGALRRLNELGMLSKVTHISAVSGGSILAAHMARSLRWPLPPGSRVPPEEWNAMVASFWRLASTNLRTEPMLRRLLHPRGWFDSSTAVTTMARTYERLIGPESLAALPPHPSFTFFATDLTFGTSWRFERSRMGNEELGFWDTNGVSIGRAVAASSCFPPVFGPMPLALPAERITEPESGWMTTGWRIQRMDALERDRLLGGLRLSDGGLVDNLGIARSWRDARLLLISDGGGTFDFVPDTGGLKAWARRFMRYASVADNRLRRGQRHLLLAFAELAGQELAFWGIDNVSPVADGEKDNVGARYPDDIVAELISEIRTDLDAFSEAEMKALENHGYIVGANALVPHIRGWVGPGALRFDVPHRRYLDDLDLVRRELADSARRKLPLGRESHPPPTA